MQRSMFQRQYLTPTIDSFIKADQKWSGALKPSIDFFHQQVQIGARLKVTRRSRCHDYPAISFQFLCFFQFLSSYLPLLPPPLFWVVRLSSVQSLISFQLITSNWIIRRESSGRGGGVCIIKFLAKQATFHWLMEISSDSIFPKEMALRGKRRRRRREKGVELFTNANQFTAKRAVVSVYNLETNGHTLRLVTFNSSRNRPYFVDGGGEGRTLTLPSDWIGYWNSYRFDASNKASELPADHVRPLHLGARVRGIAEMFLDDSIQFFKQPSGFWPTVDIFARFGSEWGPRMWSGTNGKIRLGDGWRGRRFFDRASQPIDVIEKLSSLSNKIADLIRTETLSWRWRWFIDQGAGYIPATLQEQNTRAHTHTHTHTYTHARMHKKKRKKEKGNKKNKKKGETRDETQKSQA